MPYLALCLLVINKPYEEKEETRWFLTLIHGLHKIKICYINNS